MTPRTLHILILIFAVFAVYFNALGNDFAWDDGWIIQLNPAINSFGNTGKIFTNHLASAYTAEANNFYRPLQEFSLMIDHFLWGKTALGYHFTNIVFHTLLVLIVYLLGIRLLASSLAAFAGALFYAIHPIHTEVVTYISGRADSLMAFFGCLSFYLFIKARDKNSDKYYIYSLIAFFFALLSKESAVIIPFIFLAYTSVCEKKGLRGDRSAPVKVVPYFALALVYGFARFTFLNFSKNLPETIIAHTSIFVRLAVFMQTIVSYLGIMVFPVNLHMERTIVDFSKLPRAIMVIDLALIAALVFLCVEFYKKKKIAVFFIIWYLIGLLPYSNVYPINATMAEHWVYFASIGLFFIMGLSVEKFYQAYKSLIYKVLILAIVSAALLFYCSQTIMRNTDWKNSETILTNTLKYSPSSYKVWCNLGSYYNKKGDYDKAIDTLKKAIELNEDYYISFDNLTFSYFKKGKGDEAINILEKFIAKHPEMLMPRTRLALLYEKTGNIEKALDTYRKILEIFPDNINALRNVKRLGNTPQ